MLQHLGTGNGALLVNMPDYEYRDALCFGKVHQGHGAFLYLGDAAGRRGALLGIKGLDGVDHQYVRAELIYGFQNILHGGFGQYKQPVSGNTQPYRPHFQLGFRFLTGDIEHLETL